MKRNLLESSRSAGNLSMFFRTISPTHSRFGALSFLDDVGLSGKITVGFIPVLVILTGACAVTYFSLDKTNSLLKDHARRTNNIMLEHQIERSFLELRWLGRSEAHHENRLTPEAMAPAQTAVTDAITQTIPKIRAPKRQRLLARIKQNYAEYSSVLGELLRVRSEEVKLGGEGVAPSDRRIAGLALAMETQRNQMAQLAQSITEDLHEVIDSSTEDNRRLAEETAMTTDRAQSLALWLMILALVVGGVLAKVIGLHISKPVEEEQAARQRLTAEKRKEEMLALADFFEQVVGGVVTAVTTAADQLQGAARLLSAGATDSKAHSNQVIDASRLASANVSSVASATEQLSYSIREIAEQTQRSYRIASDAAGEAEKTYSCVNELAEGAHRIGGVVQIISEIAAQTNMLALNATIEAARAGESGKGFAVVAQEVKALASQTARATEDVAKQIANIQTSAQNAAGLVASITQTTQEVSSIASSIASSVEEQDNATRDIARNVQEASGRTEDVSTKIADTILSLGKSTDAAGQVFESATLLAAQSRKLQSECEHFLQQIRSNETQASNPIKNASCIELRLAH